MDADTLKKKRSFISVFKEYQNVALRRAKLRDINLILDLYLRDYEYVLDGIFANVAIPRRELLDRMLRGSFGLGYLGYLRFYIIEIDGRTMGMIMPDFGVEPSLYGFLDRITLSWFVKQRAGSAAVKQVLRNVKALLALRINYISLTPEAMGKGVASQVLRLLKQAFIESCTNGFRAQMITAFVRNDNLASIKLFRKAKFVREDLDVDPATDPTRRADADLLRFMFTGKEDARRLAAELDAPPPPALSVAQ